MSKIDLDEAVKARIFERRILRRFLRLEDGSPLPAKPQFIILGGQPGAGKTGVMDLARQEARKSGATWTVNADEFAAYHPAYKQLQRQYGAEAADMVRGVTGDWIKRTVAAAQSRGVNVVFESTMRQPEVVRRTLAEFRARGYETHAKVLAVPPMVSWQGNHIRRESLAEKGAPSRLATREAHDAAVAGSVATVAMIEAERLVDRLSVVTRQGGTIFRNVLIAGSWADEPRAADTLQACRGTPMSPAEAIEHDRTWATIEKMARRRHARDGAAADVAAKEIGAIRRDRAADAAVTHLHRIDRSTGKPRRDPGRGI